MRQHFVCAVLWSILCGTEWISTMSTVGPYWGKYICTDRRDLVVLACRYVSGPSFRTTSNIHIWSQTHHKHNWKALMNWEYIMQQFQLTLMLLYDLRMKTRLSAMTLIISAYSLSSSPCSDGNRIHKSKCLISFSPVELWGGVEGLTAWEKLLIISSHHQHLQQLRVIDRSPQCCELNLVLWILKEI